MPGQDGYDLIAHIRTKGEGYTARELPAIADYRLRKARRPTKGLGSGLPDARRQTRRSARTDCRCRQPIGAHGIG